MSVLADMFLRGPVRWGWLADAGQTPGRGLHVAIALLVQAGIERQPTVRMRRRFVRSMGVDRHAETRALASLEQAGLIEVTRHRGRRPVVRLIGHEPVPVRRIL